MLCQEHVKNIIPLVKKAFMSYPHSMALQKLHKACILSLATERGADQ